MSAQSPYGQVPNHDPSQPLAKQAVTPYVTNSSAPAVVSAPLSVQVNQPGKVVPNPASPPPSSPYGQNPNHSPDQPLAKQAVTPYTPNPNASTTENYSAPVNPMPHNPSFPFIQDSSGLWVQQGYNVKATKTTTPLTPQQKQNRLIALSTVAAMPSSNEEALAAGAPSYVTPEAKNQYVVGVMNAYPSEGYATTVYTITPKPQNTVNTPNPNSPLQHGILGHNPNVFGATTNPLTGGSPIINTPQKAEIALDVLTIAVAPTLLPIKTVATGFGLGAAFQEVPNLYNAATGHPVSLTTYAQSALTGGALGIAFAGVGGAIAQGAGKAVGGTLGDIIGGASVRDTASAGLATQLIGRSAKAGIFAGIGGAYGAGSEYVETGKVTVQNVALNAGMGAAFSVGSDALGAVNARFDVSGRTSGKVQDFVINRNLQNLEGVNDSWEASIKKQVLFDPSFSERFTMKVTGLSPIESGVNQNILPTIPTAPKETINTRQITVTKDVTSEFNVDAIDGSFESSSSGLPDYLSRQIDFVSEKYGIQKPTVKLVESSNPELTARYNSGKNEVTIALNQSIEQQQLDLAHELGHAVAINAPNEIVDNLMSENTKAPIKIKLNIGEQPSQMEWRVFNEKRAWDIAENIPMDEMAKNALSASRIKDVATFSNSAPTPRTNVIEKVQFNRSFESSLIGRKGLVIDTFPEGKGTIIDSFPITGPKDVTITISDEQVTAENLGLKNKAIAGTVIMENAVGDPTGVIYGESVSPEQYYGAKGPPKTSDLLENKPQFLNNDITKTNGLNIRSEPKILKLLPQIDSGIIDANAIVSSDTVGRYGSITELPEDYGVNWKTPRAISVANADVKQPRLPDNFSDLMSQWQNENIFSGKLKGFKLSSNQMSAKAYKPTVWDELPHTTFDAIDDAKLLEPKKLINNYRFDLANSKADPYGLNMPRSFNPEETEIPSTQVQHGPFGDVPKSILDLVANGKATAPLSFNEPGYWKNAGEPNSVWVRGTEPVEPNVLQRTSSKLRAIFGLTSNDAVTESLPNLIVNRNLKISKLLPQKYTGIYDANVHSDIVGRYGSTSESSFEETNKEAAQRVMDELNGKNRTPDFIESSNGKTFIVSKDAKADAAKIMTELNGDQKYGVGIDKVLYDLRSVSQKPVGERLGEIADTSKRPTSVNLGNNFAGQGIVNPFLSFKGKNYYPKQTQTSEETIYISTPNSGLSHPQQPSFITDVAQKQQQNLLLGSQGTPSLFANILNIGVFGESTLLNTKQNAIPNVDINQIQNPIQEIFPIPIQGIDQVPITTQVPVTSPFTEPTMPHYSPTAQTHGFPYLPGSSSGFNSGFDTDMPKRGSHGNVKRRYPVQTPEEIIGINFGLKHKRK